MVEHEDMFVESLEEEGYRAAVCIVVLKLRVTEGV